MRFSDMINILVILLDWQIMKYLVKSNMKDILCAPSMIPPETHNSSFKSKVTVNDNKMFDYDIYMNCHLQTLYINHLTVYCSLETCWSGPAQITRGLGSFSKTFRLEKWIPSSA